MNRQPRTLFAAEPSAAALSKILRVVLEHQRLAADVGGRAKQAGRRATGEAELVFPDGDDIVREGDVGHDMFIVQSGQVRISKRKIHGEVVLATLDKGDFFGEMSLLESLPREATAHAVGETRLLVLSRGGLLFRLRRDPTFALEMLNHLSSRLRAVQARLIALEADVPEPAA
ncbi:MAG: cyclic nucleotide-binding domain-containing protein [Pseudonocardiaceae bacterium]